MYYSFLTLDLSVVEEALKNGKTRMPADRNTNHFKHHFNSSGEKVTKRQVFFTNLGNNSFHACLCFKKQQKLCFLYTVYSQR